jgi:transposase InsO family protein
LDLLGPFKKVPEGLTHLLVMTNQFTKWIEARPMAKIGSRQAVNFIQDIIFYFGVPNSIITDNDTQFTGEKFLEFCNGNNIRVDWATVAHPCTNGQVERANDLILKGLKPRILTQEGEDVHAWLSTRAGKWAAEVPSILWSLRTTPNRLTNFTPFFMVYGA